MEISIVTVHQSPHQSVSVSMITFRTKVCLAPHRLSLSERDLELQASCISVLIVSIPSSLCRVDTF